MTILPTAPYSSDEIAVLKTFLSGGGSVFILGENGYDDDFTVENAAVNADLAALGGGLQINDDYYLEGAYSQITTSRIASDPLTVGVNTFTYAQVASVSGGTPLFYTQDADAPFVAYESTPEPSSLALLAAGAIGLLGYGWRRRRKQKRSLSIAGESGDVDTNSQEAPVILSMPSRWTQAARRAA